ncbi:MAG: helix-turn-helix domain-containing protein [Chlorobium limicola]|uniref:Transcriptional regulator, XRE family n=1 Tax=Chlorobium limicola (strain DSM 245 / NBRC 103803 / 6330) TaxID=290315 RepID=B3EE81_CHLL2|nr:helix-turn-helix domain-containing protein [Chlorobium limicola]ACD89215.1 transcriptional regulator, XRE family [Chlorobium limicola DSM 245]NTV21665.1 helix-turn-helix domain-containing protein [Chlorobium limicola]
MKIEGTLTDEAILGELGCRLAQRRLELQLSQGALAEQAGVSKRTVERVEAGATTQMSSMIRVMRVLGLLEQLEALVPEAGPRPLELLKLKGKARKRARTKQKPAEEKPWTWGDES